jgi:hypothetical protein
MSEEVTPTEEVKTNDAAVSEEQSTDNSSSESVKESELDPRAAKALSDLQKYKAKVRELEEAKEKERLERMRQNEQWQELAKEHELKASELANENKTLKESLVFDKKYSAVKAAALSSGLRKEALSDLELIDLEGVEIETTSTGRINVLNADRVVEQLKTQRPHWFGRKGGNINSGDPEVVGSKEVTYDDLYKAEEKARKSGDYAPYKSLLMKFRQQKSL